ncbi:DUF3114 domain-containing protein [Floricoccus penangensis]|uniref:DUF3114 domain-containing protein n=1 Tax=Floricoccus penangensis TaxID=1859475 RepID=UPI00203CD2A3|nr:DUF3114 domain-containing protein [Floricoccus penangensis]URZ86791.1 DUF3114 domain-containing protein [Floricoccus penangensis]
MKWFERLKENIRIWFASRKTKIRRIRGQSFFDYESFVSDINIQTQKLLKKYGWDNSAISAYIKYLNKKLVGLSPSEAEVMIRDVYALTKQVGSRPYIILYGASKMPPIQKITLVLHHLGTKVDEFGFQHLNGSHTIFSEIPPHSEFFTMFRYDVLLSFPTKEGLNVNELGREIHLFRSYIDKQNIEFIRNNFSGENDYQKLLAYGRKFKLPFDYTTGANYHNRYMELFEYPHNMKVQVPKINTSKKRKLNNARMSEFIVDMDTGKFVSQWDTFKYGIDGKIDSNPDHYLPEELEGVANTESYNYGIPWGGYRDIPTLFRSSHRTLDINHPRDPEIRRKATRYWKSENDFERDEEASGRYLDIVKNEEVDYMAWMNIPADQKKDTYNEFIKYCGNSQKSNPGFAEFDKNKKNTKQL